MGLFETYITVRYVETDQMGIVHHSNYYAWFEVARTEFIASRGIKYSDMEKIGVMLPLIESGCNYKIGAKYEDQLIITTTITNITPVKVEFKYDVIRKNDGKLIASGFTKHVFVNNSFKPVNLQKHFPKIWELFQKTIV